MSQVLMLAEKKIKQAGNMVEFDNKVLLSKKQILEIKLEKGVVDPDDVEMLEDLIAAAFNDAVRRAEELQKEKMASVTAGMPLPPGFKMPF